MKHSDVVVVGAGIVGASIACGIARQGVRVVLLDKRKAESRASLGNFGLVWVQGKGQGARRYAEWCHQASREFPEFVRQLLDETGIDIQYRKPGGLVLSHGEEEYLKRVTVLERLRSESRDGTYDCEMLDRQAVQRLTPKLELGANIVGASYSPHDGYLNPLALLRAVHVSFRQQGGVYHADSPVKRICYEKDRFVITTPQGQHSAEKLVIAAGLATESLAAMVGINAPVIPERGQLMVSARVQPMLSIPVSGIQQTVEGSFIVGLSNEKIGINTDTDSAIIKRMASRVRNAFPALGGLRIVRTWASLRVLTPDGLPIYQQSEACPGAFAVTSHSGVTLTPLHMNQVPEWIMKDIVPAEFDNFSSRRFHVEAVA
ncbi:MAG: FAD-dependent oxidoreductase [Desulfuromonadales bacterium]|nr:FAD-dependent oxidoreductase [Desulfuromonadales bacterium]